MKSILYMWLCLIATIQLSSCTTVDVVKVDAGKKQKGIRYYRPKPYLFIAPSGGGGGSSEARCGDTSVNINCGKGCGTKPGGNAGNTTPVPDKTTDAVKVSISLQYLPDFSEEYAIQLRPGLGSAQLAVELENGWNLTKIGIQTDQQTDEIINSIANLASSLGSAIAADSGPEKRTVPIGYYEAVIAVDSCGEKRLFGWRYVGFTPVCGCDVCPLDSYEHVDCRNDFWELKANKKGELIFQKIEDCKYKVLPEP